MKLIRGIGDGITLIAVLTLMAVMCLIFGSWNPGGEDE